MDPLTLLPLFGELLKKHSSAPQELHTDVHAAAGVTAVELAGLRAQLAAAQAETEHWRSLAMMMLQARGLLPPK